MILYNKVFVSAVVYSHPVTLAPAVQNTVYELAHLLGRYVEAGSMIFMRSNLRAFSFSFIASSKGILP